MGEIKDFVNVYIEDSGMIEEKLSEIETQLKFNIQDQLYPGHGFIRGDLHDSIETNVASSNKEGGVIEAYTQLYYAPFVNDGHHSFGGYHFMETGLDQTVAMYR